MILLLELSPVTVVGKTGVGMREAELLFRELEPLVTELLKKDPDARKIKELAAKAGIEYTSDPIEMMGLVLKSMNKVEALKAHAKRKSDETSL